MHHKRFTRSRERSAGFTLIEMLLVLLFATAVMVMGLPALQQMIHRSRLEGATRECAVMCQRARLEAIKQGTPVVVRFDTKERLVNSWIDLNADGVQDAGEVELMVMQLPGTIQLEGPSTTPAIEGFTTDADGGWVMFFTDGSIDESGSVHFADVRSNFLQLELNPRATGNVQIKKWDPIESEWSAPREGKPWEWY